MPTTPQELLPYIVVAVVAFFFGQGMGASREEYRLEVIEATFLRDDNNIPKHCAKAFKSAKNNPDYELLADPYEGLHE